MEEASKPPTPTEVLIRCMEDFGNDEPEQVVVIYRTKKGDLAWFSNDLSSAYFLGMLRMTEFYFLENRRKEVS